MTIYQELIDRVSNGETFHIDFEKRTMKVGKDKLIDGGEYEKERKLIEHTPADLDMVLEMIHGFYHEYKFSLPSERSDSKRKKYFKALPIEKITDEQLLYVSRREVAQAGLEGFILCIILLGEFVWDEERLGRWFWQSKHESDLVILRGWIENKNN